MNLSPIPIENFALMFELELQNTEKDRAFASERLGMLRKVIESLSDIVDQMEIKASDRGLSIQVMDAMHVALADIFFSRDTFSSYRCDRDVQLGIPLKHLLTILRGITVEERSLLRFSCEDSPQTLKIEHVMDGSQYEFDITLYQIGSENYVVPEITYECSVGMPSDQFRSISRIIGSFGEYIRFRCDKDRLSFRQTGDLVSNKMDLRANSETVHIDCSSSVELEIAMKYVNIVNKVSVLSNEITLNMGESCPVFFGIKLSDLGHIKFYVAPKVD
jgi:proliferating cell nuclear antigen